MPLIAQPPDSTVSVERWIMWRLIRDAESFRSCDTLRVMWREVALAADSTVQAKNDAIKAQQDQIKVFEAQLATSENRRDNQVQYTQEIKKEVRKWKLLSIASGVLLLVVIAL